MYAVIETGGKQYRVELGTELEVELLDVEPGQEISLDRILLVSDGERTAIGRPLVANAAVNAQVLRQDRGEKTISFKYRPKARRRVKKGHRQELTVLKITEVRLGAKSAAAEAKEAAAKAEAEREKISKAAARQAAEDKALADQLKARAKAAAAETEAEAPKKTTTAAKTTPAAKAKTTKETSAAEAPAKPATRAPKAAATGEAAAKKPAPTKKDE
jgi:large subunit ribosomal protein L21